jgi:hypothetical protein
VAADADVVTTVSSPPATATDVAAHVIRIVAFETGRSPARNGEDPVAETRGEALDLTQDPVRHVHGGAVGHVAVGPDRVPPPRRSGWIEERWLGEQNERLFGNASLRNGRLAPGDLLEGPADVNSGCPEHFRIAPRDWSIKGHVELECTGPMPKAAQLPQVEFAPAVSMNSTPRQFENLARRKVEQQRTMRWQLVQRSDPAVKDNRAAKFHKMCSQRVADSL